MIYRPIISAPTLLKHNSIFHESYIEQYPLDNDFHDVYASLSQGNQVDELDYHFHDNFLYYLGKICTPEGEKVNIIREAHTSLIASHFNISKMLSHLQRNCYWPPMLESVSHFIKGCSLCAINMPRNRKLGLYTPLMVPSRPWESVSMDFVGGIPLSRKGHDYLYVVVIGSTRCAY